MVPRLFSLCLGIALMGCGTSSTPAELDVFVPTATADCTVADVLRDHETDFDGVAHDAPAPESLALAFAEAATCAQVDMSLAQANQTTLFRAGTVSILRAGQMLDEGRAVEAADLALDIWDISLRQGAPWGLMSVAIGAHHGARAMDVVEDAWPHLTEAQRDRLATRVSFLAKVDLSPRVILEREIAEMTRQLSQGSLAQRLDMLQELMAFRQLMNGDFADASRAETAEAFLAAAPDPSGSSKYAAWLDGIWTDFQANIDRAEKLSRTT